MNRSDARTRHWFWMCLALMVLVLPGNALAQGKRLGLVVGMADYGDHKHPTALQDAGLVAQSLRQAGFDLTEAANLNQTEFRATFRDFLEKIQAAGPGALVAVYLAGIGFQDDGENLLIPVDARLRQRADLSLEALRISDLLRSLGASPASGRFVMLDAAYTHPLAQLAGTAAGAGAQGFAPIEPREGMLIAFNQMPDQAAALPNTSYGFYAMALAEILREPGLDLATMFERIRLRTHDLSQGAQTPWNVNALNQAIILQPGAIAAAEAPMFAKRSRAIRDLPGDEAYARAVEIDTIPVYEEFLAAYPRHAQAKRVRAMIAMRREAYYWQRARRVNTDRAYWSYLRRYPRGSHAAEAQARLTRLSAPILPPPQFEEIVYDDLAPPGAEEVAIYEDVVVEERWHALPPPSGYAVHLLPPPPVEIIELPPPPSNPQARTLPPVAIGAAIVGAGAIGAAIWANREWRRPRDVRPAVVLPPRPARPSILPPGTVVPPPPPPNFRAPTVLPGRTPLVGQPTQPGVMPPGVVVPPGTRPGAPGPLGTQPPQPGVMPPGTPPGVVVPPGPRPGAPGQLGTQPPQPGVMPPGTPPGVVVPPGPRPGAPGQLGTQPPQPGVMPPGTPPAVVVPPGTRPGAPGPLGTQPPQPGVMPPGTPPGAIRPGPSPATQPPRSLGTPPGGINRVPTAPPPLGAPPPPPGVTPPTAPQAPRPLGTPPAVQTRPVPNQPPPPPGYRPVPRPGPGELPPGYRPVPRPPGTTPMPVQPQPRAMPVAPPQQPRVIPITPPQQPRAAPPAPPPQMRQAPTPPVAQPRPVAPPPPPVVRPASPPPAAARPAAPAPLGQCTPELRARGACR